MYLQYQFVPVNVLIYWYTRAIVIHKLISFIYWTKRHLKIQIWNHIGLLDSTKLTGMNFYQTHLITKIYIHVGILNNLDVFADI